MLLGPDKIRRRRICEIDNAEYAGWLGVAGDLYFAGLLWAALRLSSRSPTNWRVSSATIEGNIAVANSMLRSSDRTWADWLAIALGIAIVLAPWVTLQTTNRTVVINAAVAGFAVMMLAELDLLSVRRWTEVGQLMLGGWVAASPIIFGYVGGGPLRIWHFLAGLLVAVLGAMELWQHGSEKGSSGEIVRRNRRSRRA